MNTPEPTEPPSGQKLPLTPEAARALAYLAYRKHTRPFRRTFRGVISRREAERFAIARIQKQNRALGGVA